jgi:hypothetical protein
LDAKSLLYQLPLVLAPDTIFLVRARFLDLVLGLNTRKLGRCTFTSFHAPCTDSLSPQIGSSLIGSISKMEEKLPDDE